MDKQRLLLVDDLVETLEMYADYLSWVGFDVHVAKDGATALEEAAQWNPDLIILDVELPGLNGFEVLEQLRRRHIATRVIMLTGSPLYLSLESAVSAIRSGACDYLHKPVLPTELVSRVRRCLLLDSTLNLTITEQAPFVQALVEREGAPLVQAALEQIRQRQRRQRFSNRVFIVHGHDDSLKDELSRFLTQIGLRPVILHQEADRGRTLLDKLGDEMQDVGFAFVLLTPDDPGGAPEDANVSQRRARQNVIFEHGFFIGALGPSRVCAIEKGEVERPSDLEGVLYKPLRPDQSIESIGIEIGKELIAAGYKVNDSRIVSSQKRARKREATARRRLADT